jgi:LmbE family N-acetylglucosaminyl deacetylase
MRLTLWFVLVCAASGLLAAQTARSAKKVILAVGAHAGDMEVAAAGVLARHVKAGDRVVFLHLTLGEGGNPRMSPEQYGAQKRREAEAAARAIGAEVRFGPYVDGELPNNEEARRFVADEIRQVKPTHLLTHWKNSLHKDHAATCAVATDAVLLAALPGVKSRYSPHAGVRRVLYTENWEDREGFTPYVYIDISESLSDWEKCVTQYEFVRGGISTYPYLEYYRALARVRGADAGFTYAEAFDIDSWSKKQVYPSLP